MHGFSDVTLGWQDSEYVVPADRVMMLVCQIEDALSGPEGEQALTVLMRRQGPPHGRLAAAYGAALRYAGADVSDAEVYLSMQTDLSGGGADAVNKMQSAVIAMIAIVSPPIGSALLELGQKKTKATPKKAKGAE